MLVNNQYSRTVSGYSSNMQSDISNMSTEVPFADKLREAMSEEEAKEFEPTNSIGVVLRQMNIKGEESKQIEHNGVKISFSINPSRGTEITIGESDPNGNWKSIKTKDGIVRFNANDPKSIMKCLDLFTPEEINQIMMILSLEKKVQEMEEKIEEELAESVETVDTKQKYSSEEIEDTE